MGSATNESANDARSFGSQASASAARMGETAKDAVSRAANEAKAGAERVVDDAGEELAKLRSQVERLMAERVTPAIAGAAEQVEGYANRAKAAVEERADSVADSVRDRPLLSITIAAVCGYVLGRLMGGGIHYDHRR